MASLSEGSQIEGTAVSSEAIPQSQDVEKLGRQRPEVFSSTWMEVAFVASMLGALAMADFIISGFQVVLPALIEPLDIPPSSQTWPSGVLTLVAGALLFPLGRLADMYGGYIIFNGGLVWFTIWTVITGFSKSFTMLVLCRAMEGLGAAAFLPAGISLLGRIYRPGPRKNLVFSLYGAVAPMGFFLGIITGGMAQDLMTWRWYFWLGAIIAALCTLGTLLTAPCDYAETRKMGVKMDWLGVFTMVPATLLVVYAFTDSTHAPQGWKSPQILITLFLGLGFLAAAVYVQGWVAQAPLIPGDIFRVRFMKRMLACLFITWGVFSIYLFYANFYIELVIGHPALLTATWFAPWAVGGVILSTASGLILHILPGRLLLIIASVSKILAVLLFALMPRQPNYWAWVFPAMVAETACVDVLWTVSNVFLTTSLPRHRQGLAGALISVSLFLGGAFFLAIAEVAAGEFKKQGMDLKEQYQGVFWVGVGLATVALFISIFIKLGQAGSALTVDEKLELEPESDSDVHNRETNGKTDDVVTVCVSTPVEEKTEWVAVTANEKEA